MTISSSDPARRSSGAFSLLELIMVLALVAVLAALAAQGYSSAVQSAAIASGADMINEAFTEARANAVAQNTEVEVRIYLLSSQPGLPPAYTALQSHWVKADGTTPPASQVVQLPSWVAIDSTSARSTLIAANTEAATPDASDSRLNSNTRVFHFLPDGSTDLSSSTSWFLTVRAATQSDPSRFPVNWACVGIDPTTGRAQTYRP
jgi:uncharacterized protein (TIGR02596 family)